jgi:hypothetical protein
MVCFFLAVLCPQVVSHGGIIYTNGDPFADNGTHYSKSDTVPRSQIGADNFVISSNATIDSVRWWGSWNFFNSPNDNFTVNFYGDNGGLPDPSNLISSQSIGNAMETSTGLTRSFFTLVEFQSNITPVSLTAGTDYWISIFDTAGTNDGQYFIWRETAVGAAASSTNDGFSWGGRPLELAFQFEGNITAVPEPSTFFLFIIVGSCAAATSAFRRRRSTASLREG